MFINQSFLTHKKHCQLQRSSKKLFYNNLLLPLLTAARCKRKQKEKRLRYRSNRKRIFTLQRLGCSMDLVFEEVDPLEKSGYTSSQAVSANVRFSFQLSKIILILFLTVIAVTPAGKSWKNVCSLCLFFSVIFDQRKVMHLKRTGLKIWLGNAVLDNQWYHMK